MRAVGNGLRALLVFTVLTGLIYPALITVIAKMAFGPQSTGSLLWHEKKLIGSKLLAQKIEDPAYFWCRPSAGDYATVASAASNLSPASQKFVEEVERRKKTWGINAPADLLTTSASGLDPHVSPEAALYQVSRVVKARGLSGEGGEKLKGLITMHIENKTFGILGMRRVNIMVLNQALDEAFPKR